MHALREIARVLKPHGTLVDIRPDRFNPRRRRPALPAAYWRSSHGDVLAGTLGKVASNLRRHRAATRVLRDAIRRRVFVLEATEMFPFRYHFRDQATFDAYLKLRWISTILPTRVRRRLMALRNRYPRGEIVVVEPVRLNVLRKP